LDCANSGDGVLWSGHASRDCKFISFSNLLKDD
jgi:hypothetical protein